MTGMREAGPRVFTGCSRRHRKAPNPSRAGAPQETERCPFVTGYFFSTVTPSGQITTGHRSSIAKLRVLGEEQPPRERRRRETGHRGDGDELVHDHDLVSHRL